MKKCNYPEHHDQSGKPSPWVWVVLVVVLAAGSPAAARVVSDVLWVAAAVVGVLAVAATAALVIRHRRRQARLYTPGRPMVVVISREQARLGRSAARAIASPRRDASAFSRDDAPTYVVNRSDVDQEWS